MGTDIVTITVNNPQTSVVDAGLYDAAVLSSVGSVAVNLHGKIIEGVVAKTEWSVSPDAERFVTFGDCSSLDPHP